MLEEQLQANLLAQSRQLVADLAPVNQRLTRQRAGKGLTEEEQVERQCVMLARRLPKEQLEPALTELPAVPGVTVPAKDAVKPAR